MARFRKRPVVINALQWTGENITELLDFVKSVPSDPNTQVRVDMTQQPVRLLVHTLENTSDPLVASPGDWIIVGVKGEVYPCKPDIFSQTYEPELAAETVTA
jgi:hypothetical protein